MSAIPTPAEVAAAALHLQAAKYFQGASFVMLLYDHCITIGDEVERIWKRKLSGASILFLLNRYLTPLQYLFVVDAFNNPNWTPEESMLWNPKHCAKAAHSCSRVVSFEGYATVGLVAVCEMIMILRIFALYGRNFWILGFLLVALAVQIIISCYGLSFGFRAPLPPGFVGCIFAGPKGSLVPAVWYAPAITDFIIFILTLWRASNYRRTGMSSAPTFTLFLRDGVLYFFTIFAANGGNLIIFWTAPDDLKAIGATFSQLITSVMISRLVLNLRGVGESSHSRAGNSGSGVPLGSWRVSPRTTTTTTLQGDDLISKAIGNLGGDLTSWKDGFENEDPKKQSTTLSQDDVAYELSMVRTS